MAAFCYKNIDDLLKRSINQMHKVCTSYLDSITRYASTLSSIFIIHFKISWEQVLCLTTVCSAFASLFCPIILFTGRTECVCFLESGAMMGDYGAYVKVFYGGNLGVV